MVAWVVGARESATAHTVMAQPVKEFGPDDKPHTRKYPLIGNPHPHLISTSLVDRANLTMRGRMRRFTRQTIGYSRNAQNHAYAVDLNFITSNFVIPHLYPDAT